jgi:type II secretory ATPase GspE/PulE/Tfp pilus assembly ATPase PilB-like protein
VPFPVPVPPAASSPIVAPAPQVPLSHPVKGDSANQHDPFWLGRRLIALGALTQQGLDLAIENFRQHSSNSFPRTLVNGGFATPLQVAGLIAERYDLKTYDLNPTAVLSTTAKKLSESRARAFFAVPIREQPGSLTIAIADPTKYFRDEAKHDFPSLNTQFVVSPHADIIATIDSAFAPPLASASNKTLLQSIIQDAITERASDIHFLPKETAIEFLFRIDGRLLHRGLMDDPKAKEAMLLAIKQFGAMDISETRVAQDGHGTLLIGSKNYNFRVSTVPGYYGECATIRLQNDTRNILPLSEFGISPENQAIFKEILSLPNGITFLTGPTGCGKTTLTHSLLNAYLPPDKKVNEVADPIEYPNSSYAQTAINPSIGFTYSHALRAILRQDPDWILAGESRDEESADVAIRAALTGHVVFATLHTNDAAGAITRLLDLKIEPFAIVSAVKGLAAVRLIRKLCACKKPLEQGEVLDHLESRFGPGSYFQPCGCELCKGTGYFGRTAICEVYRIPDELHPLILKKADANTLSLKLHELGFPSIQDDAIAKLKRGVTTFSELLSQITIRTYEK